MKPQPPTRTEAKIDEDQHHVARAADEICNGGRERIRRKLTRKHTRAALKCLEELDEAE